ncbi:hypothetical protein XOCgx_0137 [Xanthomonas oryzae pv. oryzicola]|nr:hypothetical protein XOCgx_0137 [Xanthomonas oryzae pv. oryzicola]
MDPARLRPRRARWPEHSAAVVLVLAVHGVLVLCLSRVAAPSITARNDTDAPRMMLEFIARAAANQGADTTGGPPDPADCSHPVWQRNQGGSVSARANTQQHRAAATSSTRCRRSQRT